MKTKKFSKKLLLNKKTIADLNNVKLKNVPGGGHDTVYITCPPCIVTDDGCTYSCETCNPATYSGNPCLPCECV